MATAPGRMRLTELDHQHSVPLPLIWRQDNDTGQVVIVVRYLLFGEEAKDMVSGAIRVGENVEQNYIDTD